jgi:hypothetical protein
VSSVNKPVDSGFSSIAEGYGYNGYEKVEIIPVLLGETDKGGPKPFICSKNVFVV